MPRLRLVADAVNRYEE